MFCLPSVLKLGRKAKSISQLKSDINFPLDLKRKNLNHDIPLWEIYSSIVFFFFSDTNEIPTACSRLNKQRGCRSCLYFTVWIFGRFSESAPLLCAFCPPCLGGPVWVGLVLTVGIVSRWLS